jgi:hypothetical protein
MKLAITGTVLGLCIGLALGDDPKPQPKEVPCRTVPAVLKSVTYDYTDSTITVTAVTPTTGWLVSAQPKEYAERPDWWRIDISAEAPPPDAPTLAKVTAHTVVIKLADLKDRAGKPASGKEGVELVGVRQKDGKTFDATTRIGFAK